MDSSHSGVPGMSTVRGSAMTLPMISASPVTAMMPPSPSPRTSRVVSAVSSAYSGTLVLRVTASSVRPSGSST